MRRRTILRAAASLLAGLLITLTVATAISLRIMPEPTPTTRVIFDWDHPHGAGWLMTVDQMRPGWTRRMRSLVAPSSHGLASAPTGGANILLQITSNTKLGDHLPIVLDPDEADATFGEKAAAIASLPQYPVGTLMCWPMQTRVGWPLRCMAYWYDGVYGWGETGIATGSKPVVIARGYRIGKPATMFGDRVIPLQPLWAGLVGNTLLYGGAIFAIVTAVSAPRAAYRHRRGLCARCGYDLAGLATCPECGEAA
jgi:hypothetical protein